MFYDLGNIPITDLIIRNLVSAGRRVRAVITNVTFVHINKQNVKKVNMFLHLYTKK